MVLILCVDDRDGMLFNGRRQSSDRKVTEEILKLCEGKRLRINHYSADLFPCNPPLLIADDFLDCASDGDCCFVENVDVAPYLARTEKLILFRWNRKYPADLFFPGAWMNKEWNMVNSSEFSGHSHDRITMEVYCR